MYLEKSDNCLFEIILTSCSNGNDHDFALCIYVELNVLFNLFCSNLLFVNI